jgi:hypothetical protein
LEQVTLQDQESLLTLIQQKDKQIELLQNRVICTRNLQDNLQSKGKSHVGKWSMLASESGYTVNRRRAVTRMWGDYKKHFGGLRSYRDTLEINYETALHWIDAWTLPTYLMEQPPLLLGGGESQ